MSSLKRLTLPGFEKVPLHRVLKVLFNEVRSPIMILRAKAIAYSFFIAIFPTVVFLFSLVSYIPIDNLANNIVGYLTKISPNKQMVEMFKPIISDVISRPKSGILTIGFLLIIFFMKNGVMTMMQSFNIHWEIRSGKLFIRNQLLSILITLAILSLFVATIILVILGSTITKFVFNFFDYDGHILNYFIDFLRYSLTIGMNFMVISILYYLGPAIRPRIYKIFTPGSIAATTLIVIVSYLFSYYIRNFANYNKLYGSLGTLILMLLWLYWNALSILIGFELNRSIDILKLRKRK